MPPQSTQDGRQEERAGDVADDAPTPPVALSGQGIAGTLVLPNFCRWFAGGFGLNGGSAMRLATTIIAVVFGFTLLSIGAGLMTAASALTAALEREHANDSLSAGTSVGPDLSLSTFYLIVGGVLVVAGALAFATGWGAAVLAFIATIIGGLGSAEEGASALLMMPAADDLGNRRRHHRSRGT